MTKNEKTQTGHSWQSREKRGARKKNTEWENYKHGFSHKRRSLTCLNNLTAKDNQSQIIYKKLNKNVILLMSFFCQKYQQ